ncbi:hypothetical protein B0T26DRAFT_689021 [Lasiosphaeria miniovina]|uniref:Uncharacterized protein n=1 Tax=Lasiosphaeria miniovina TaxID=1954250 RepID=A0AA40BHZ6_9PEZI|nr:uncharacterized protein B0T26DRAFT_689021 [Lasiosphaeria miniovina]KAK0734593.1 hypothetical protein B0T26DRAFT_689021 [Lasiosphaeria miniovina]
MQRKTSLLETHQIRKAEPQGRQLRQIMNATGRKMGPPPPHPYSSTVLRMGNPGNQYLSRWHDARR